MNHSGNISSPETWASADSPHIVTDHIYLTAVLTIEAGCEVKVADAKLIYVRTNGKIIAVGIAGNFIEFKKNANNWYGIKYPENSSYTPASGGQFQYCKFTGIDSGFQGYLVATQVSNTYSVDHCIFIGSGGSSWGITESSGTDLLTIDHCVFDNFWLGCYIDRAGGSLTVKNSILINNTYALYRSNGTATSQYNNFYNNTTDYQGTIGDKTGDELNRDPLFVGGDPYDYHLQAGSPCLGDGESGSDMGALGTAVDTYTKTILSDAHIKAAIGETILSDAHIKATKTETILSDAAIKKTDITETIQSDAVIKQSGISEDILSDASIIYRITKEILSDAHIKVFGIEKTILSDAFINVKPVVSNISASQNSSGIVDIGYDVTDIEQSQVTISFEYWNGSAWIACSTVTGDGLIDIGTGKSGTWTAKTDYDGHYTTDIKIRVKADDGKGGVGYGESSTFELDTKDPVYAGNVSPADEATEIDRRPTLTAGEVTEDLTYQFQFEIAKDDSFAYIIKTSEWQDSNIFILGLTFRRLYYSTDYWWRVKIKDAKSNQTTGTGTKFTTKVNTKPIITIGAIEKAVDGTGYIIINYTLTDATFEDSLHEKDLCNIQFEFTDDIGISFHEGEIISCDEGTIVENNRINGVSSSASGENHWLKWKSITDTNILNLNSELDKKVIKTSSRITIYRDDTPTIVMGGSDRDYQNVKGYNIEKSKNLGSIQLTLQCANKDGLFSPERQYISGSTPNEINYLSGAYSPLYYFMNKIKIEEMIEINGVNTYFERFNGWISTIMPSKIAGITEAMEVIAFDAIYTKLNRYKPDDLHYTPTKVLLEDDTLTTVDGTTFEGTHSNWAEYPTPIIKIDGEIQDIDIYILDLTNGKVIFRTAVGVSAWGESDGLELSNPSADRKTYESNKTDWTPSFTPIVYYYYEIYENVQYNAQVPPNTQWTSKTEVLDEGEYIVNYATGTIILVTALAADDASKVIGNKKNQKIRCQFKTGRIVTATYKYDVVGTNEVEDIIRDIAERADFETSELVKSVSDETLSTEDNIVFYAHKNNWAISPAPVIKKNDVVISSGFTIDYRAGVIQFTAALTPTDSVLDDCSFLWDTSDETNFAISKESTDYKAGPNCFKIVATTGALNDYIQLDFEYNSEKDLSVENRIGFWIKSSRTGSYLKLKMSEDGSAWQEYSITVDIADTWEYKYWDISAIASANRDTIRYLRLECVNADTEFTCYLDQIMTRKDEIICSYSYYALQKTNVTLTEGYINYKTVDDGFDAIQEILGKVAPNYLVRCNEEGILEGEYETQRLIQIKLLPNDGFDEGLWSWSNSFYKEDYMLKSNKSLKTPISDEDIYTVVVSLGEDADPPNLSVDASVVDNVSWGTIDGDKDTLIDYNVNTNVSWHTTTAEPTKGSVVCTITLDKEQKWEKIDILIGTYNDNTIQERLYIEVGDSGGVWWRPSQNREVRSGASGAWVSWENNYDEEREIKYVRVKLEEAWHWAVTTSSIKSNWMGKSKTSVTTVDHWAFALAEIQIWGKIDLVGRATLDNCIMVGDGIKTTCYIPNVPYKVKDYSAATHGWVDKSVSSVKLFKNNLTTILVKDVDYILDADTGLVTFLSGHIPIDKDVICGNWVLDILNPGGTTFLASFENKALLQRIGLREYKDEKDVGLTTHLETINRASDILPEVSRLVYPAEIEVVYRPDVKIGQTVLIKEEDLGV